AERELTMLDGGYEHVTVRRNRGERSVAELTAGFASYDALHFAAHAEASAGTPWLSGFLLGRGAGDDAYLRASDVARLQLPARLGRLRRPGRARDDISAAAARPRLTANHAGSSNPDERLRRPERRGPARPLARRTRQRGRPPGGRAAPGALPRPGVRMGVPTR